MKGSLFAAIPFVSQLEFQRLSGAVFFLGQRGGRVSRTGYLRCQRKDCEDGKLSQDSRNDGLIHRFRRFGRA